VKTKILRCFAVIALFAALATLPPVAAQDDIAQTNNARHHHYKLIDLGTFGGPQSGTQDELQVLNRRGMIAGGADTSVLNHRNACIFCSSQFISHAFEWRNGVLDDLGALPGDNSSGANWISDSGLIAGSSETVATDPLLGGIRAMHAVLWKNGEITDLGTLEGGYESIAFAVNSRGQVAGAAFTTVPDPLDPSATEQRTFLWENGVMQDLGTLGGPDAGLVGSFMGDVEMNERGQVVACSYTNFTINPVTGAPTTHPFLWDKEQGMIDLGTLGGTSACAIYINNRGQVIGYSNVANDAGCPDRCQLHPFLWQREVGIKNLGTLGGSFGVPNWISDAGDVVGISSTPGDQVLHTFLWRNGSMTDLGTVPGDVCSGPQAINSKGQVVGSSTSSATCDFTSKRGFLWEHGGPMVDLNTLVSSGSGVQVSIALDINDREEIVASGVLPNGDTHAVLLIPCDENHPNIGGCDYGLVSTSTIVNAATTVPGVNVPATANPGLTHGAIRQVLQSVDLRSTQWRGRFGAHPQK
jgi:probable HAF family extracellular repeat protein